MQVKVEGLYLKDLIFTTEENRPELLKAAARRRWFQHWRETPAQQTDLKRTGVERPNDLKTRFPTITAIRSITWKDGPTSQGIASIGTALAGHGRLIGKGKIPTSMFAGLGLTPRRQMVPKTTPPSEGSSSSPEAGA